MYAINIKQYILVDKVHAQFYSNLINIYSNSYICFKFSITSHKLFVENIQIINLMKYQTLLYI